MNTDTDVRDVTADFKELTAEVERLRGEQVQARAEERSAQGEAERALDKLQEEFGVTSLEEALELEASLQTQIAAEIDRIRTELKNAGE